MSKPALTMKKLLFVLCTLCVLVSNSSAQTTVKKVVLQAFWWDYYNANYSDKWANYLTELAPRLKAMGVDAIWIPPSVKNESPYYVGYSPFDQYDLGDKFQKNSTATRLGTKDELLRMIAVMHANGIEVIQDVVLNHTASAGSANGAGGYDPNSFSVQNSGGYKNFRYVSYATPASAETQTNYWNRSGRWPKNYTNFYPNPSNNCTTGDICSAYFGPDMSYESSAFGISSNVVGFNPAQTSNYMRNEGRNWMMWMKKQTGVDGFRWDAVKHFPTYVQEDYSYNVKYTLPSWAKGDRAMFNVGEWVGGKNELDAYVNAIAAPSGEKMMGTFDFGLRAFDGSGGLYGMVYGMGNFNMSSLPGAQQNERVAFYSATNTYVHRTVPFVNNHDTFRPQLSATGNYIGWNTGSELSAHIDPSEPRLTTAYAAIMAMDGNPQLFFEDVFDIGTQGNRFNHDPKSSTSLPARADMINLLWCHQNLDFKSGAYQVPFSNADYLIISRAGRAIIGITDSWDVWQNQWVYTGFAPGTVLKDYSGANGTSTVTVNADGWAPINTPPVNPALNVAGRHGYSVWAPVGKDALTYTPPRVTTTTQEWEMANDLGDSHVNSLGQGGALPASSTNFRVAGKIYVQSGKLVTYVLYPSLTNRNLFVGLYNSAGTLLSSKTGLGTLTGTYTPAFTGWITIKVKNNSNTNPSQKCWVNVTYTAPAVITNANAASANNTSSIWTGNAESSVWTDARNWEEGMVPNEHSVVVVPGGIFPQPAITQQTTVEELIVEEGASIFVNAHLNVSSQLVADGNLSGVGSYTVGTSEEIKLTNTTRAELFVFPNPSQDEPVSIGVNGSLDNTLLKVNLLGADGKLVAVSEGSLQFVNSQLHELSLEAAGGVYFLQCVFDGYTTTLKWVKQ
jgi:alpha-amylase